MTPDRRSPKALRRRKNEQRGTAPSTLPFDYLRLCLIAAGTQLRAVSKRQRMEPETGNAKTADGHPPRAHRSPRKDKRATMTARPRRIPSRQYTKDATIANRRPGGRKA